MREEFPDGEVRYYAGAKGDERLVRVVSPEGEVIERYL